MGINLELNLLYFLLLLDYFPSWFSIYLQKTKRRKMILKAPCMMLLALIQIQFLFFTKYYILEQQILGDYFWYSLYIQ